MNSALTSARNSSRRRFRISVITGSVVAALAGSLLLATHDSGETVTTRGVTATLRVPGHPGPVAAGPDTLWVALGGDPRRPAGDWPLLRLALATGAVAQRVHVGGEVSSLARVGGRLIASVEPTGGSGLGSRRLVALDWRSGAVLVLGESHLTDTDAREFAGPVEHVVRAGRSLWALEVRPGRLLRLDASTLAPSAAPIRLSNGRMHGLAAGEGYLWVTAIDAGQVLRIDPETGAIERTSVGGSPAGIVVAGGSVWFADRSSGSVVRMDPRSLRRIGDPIRVSARPSALAVAGDSLFVTDESTGTIARIDVRSARRVGSPIRIAPLTKSAVAPAVASTGDSVWVSSFGSNTLTRITPPGSLAPAPREVTLTGTGDGPVNPGPTGTGVANGGVSGTGRFTATGGIHDSGTYTHFRRVRGHTARIRCVNVGKHGTITIVITVNLNTGSNAWTVTSGTGSYAGLHGKGTLTVDNFESNPYTFVMKGAVSR